MFSVLLVKMLGCGAAAGAWRRGAATVTAAAALSLSGAGGPPARDAVTPSDAAVTVTLNMRRMRELGGVRGLLWATVITHLHQRQTRNIYHRQR